MNTGHHACNTGPSRIRTREIYGIRSDFCTKGWRRASPTSFRKRSVTFSTCLRSNRRSCRTNRFNCKNAASRERLSAGSTRSTCKLIDFVSSKASKTVLTGGRRTGQVWWSFALSHTAVSPSVGISIWENRYWERRIPSLFALLYVVGTCTVPRYRYHVRRRCNNTACFVFCSQRPVAARSPLQGQMGVYVACSCRCRE